MEILLPVFRLSHYHWVRCSSSGMLYFIEIMLMNMMDQSHRFVWLVLTLDIGSVENILDHILRITFYSVFHDQLTKRNIPLSRSIQIIEMVLQLCPQGIAQLVDTWFLWVGSCIRGLLSKGGSKGPCLGEVPCHQYIYILGNFFTGQSVFVF